MFIALAHVQYASALHHYVSIDLMRVLKYCVLEGDW